MGQDDSRPKAPSGGAAAPAKGVARSTTGKVRAVPAPAPAPSEKAAPPLNPALSTEVLMRASDIHKLVRRAGPEQANSAPAKGHEQPGARQSSPTMAVPARPSSPQGQALGTGNPPNRTSKPYGKSAWDEEENSDVAYLSSLRLGGEASGKHPVHRPDVNLLFDGSAPAEGVFLTNPSVIVRAPVQSYPGQRKVIHTQNVINQYAVAVNPRYFPQPQEPREMGHLFVFDVMASQHTTLARVFTTGYPGIFRPGTLAELWQWLNTKALSRSWRVLEGDAVIEAAARGLPIIAMAETPAGPKLAVVEPGPPGPEGRPLVASAHEPRGQRQTLAQVFGASPVRFLAHD